MNKAQIFQWAAHLADINVATITEVYIASEDSRMAVFADTSTEKPVFVKDLGSSFDPAEVIAEIDAFINERRARVRELLPDTNG